MKKVLLLFGGVSYEHEVSIQSAKNLYKYIDNKKFDVNCTYISKENIWYEDEKNFDLTKDLKEITNIIEHLKKFDYVINIIHGSTGEDGKIQSLLELFNIKYLGPNSISSMLCMNKELTKLILKENNISQIDYLVYDGDINKVTEKLSYPVIIKPSNGGSSIGISVANNDKELKKGIKEAIKYHDTIIIEKFIKNNIELECSVIKLKNDIYVSTIGQILPSNEFYDYEDKYIKKESGISIPAKLDNNVIKIIKDMAKKAFIALKCKDLARIDFLMDENNNIYLNEVNTLPGFTEISMFSKLLEYDKYNIKDLITNIIENNLK